MNGHILGRFDPTAGPQVSLYVPASVLIAGENVINILELKEIAPACLQNSTHCYITFRDTPVWLK